MDLIRLFPGLTPSVARQIIRYGISGLSAVISDYGTFAFLVGIAKVPLLLATILSLLAGFVVSFLLNRLWVFGARQQNAAKKLQIQFVLYCILFCFNTLFTYGFIYYSGKWFGLSAYLSKLCCIALVMLWNFVLYKKVIFRATNVDVFQAM